MSSYISFMLICWFQFQSGAIKRMLEKQVALYDKLRFNSNLVRLKASYRISNTAGQLGFNSNLVRLKG